MHAPSIRHAPNEKRPHRAAVGWAFSVAAFSLCLRPRASRRCLPLPPGGTTVRSRRAASSTTFATFEPARCRPSHWCRSWHPFLTLDPWMPFVARLMAEFSCRWLDIEMPASGEILILSVHKGLFSISERYCTESHCKLSKIWRNISNERL